MTLIIYCLLKMFRYSHILTGLGEHAVHLLLLAENDCLTLSQNIPLEAGVAYFWETPIKMPSGRRGCVQFMHAGILAYFRREFCEILAPRSDF